MDSPVAERHIYAAIRARPNLAGVSIKPAPTGPDFEGIAIRFFVPENDMVAVGEDRIGAPLQFQVVGVQLGDDASKATQWGAEAEAALKGSAPASNEFGQVFECVRIREVNTPERKDGRVRQLRGGLWRLIVRGES